jgi:hypothetical protein
MPIVIVATPGASDANSYVTADEYVAYVATRLAAPANASTDPAAITEPEKKAMIEATRDLTTPRYEGERATATQSLAWPRVWAPNPDAPTTLIDPDLFIPIGSSQIVYFAADEIPQRVKDAVCESAMQYLLAGTKDLSALDVLDVIETDYIDPSLRAKGLARWPRVIDRVGVLFSRRGAGLQVNRV